MAFVEMLNYEIYIGASLHSTVQISNIRTLIACILFFFFHVWHIY